MEKRIILTLNAVLATTVSSILYERFMSQFILPQEVLIGKKDKGSHISTASVLA